MSTPNLAQSIDVQRRFGGVIRLYGEACLQRFMQARVCVIGIGGVGSWAVEALARSGIGHLTLVDLDHVAESNINRQLHATDATLGQAKISAMAERIRSYNPLCEVTEIDDFAEPDNLDAILGQGFDFVIDAIDGVRAKVAITVWCKAHGVPLIVAGAAGGQSDPTRIMVSDLSKTEQDPLLAKMRKRLRKEHRFPRDPRRKFLIEAVYSNEPLLFPEAAACDIEEGLAVDHVADPAHANAASGPTGLNCAGFGSSICVTASFGMALAARVLHGLSSSALPAVTPVTPPRSADE